jgi:hypothetical protein
MWALLLVWVLVELLIRLFEFLVEVWPRVVLAVILALSWFRVIRPVLEYRAQESGERLRHARARREIDRIAFETSRAMHEAAVAHGGFTGRAGVIEGTATELEVRP